MCRFGAIAIGLQWVNCHRDRACQGTRKADCCLICRSPLSEVSIILWDAILVIVDGFGFGTLTGESCLKNAHCHTNRASWEAILVIVVAFGALMWKKWKKCAQSHSLGLGRVGGGRRTENRDHIYIKKNIYSEKYLQLFIISKSSL